MKKIVLLYPDSQRELKLYEDLKNLDYVKLIGIRRKAVFSGRLVHHPVSVLSRMKKLTRQYLGRIKRLIINSTHIDNFKFLKLPNYCADARILLVMDWALNDRDNLKILEKCRSKNRQLKIYLYLINQIGGDDAINRKDVQRFRFMMNQFHWDEIYSFDKADCKQFGFQYMGFNYYSMRKMVLNSNPLNDLFFTACYSKLREDMICDVYNFASKSGIICDFYIKLWKEGYDKMIDGIHYMTDGVEMMSYHDCLKKALDSKCILEIIRPGQFTPTLRYMEAVCYNKKFLTNNPQIVEYPYYNPNYMHIFDKVEDIDVEWLKDESNVDYHYQGDFSPIHLVNYLLENDK